MGDYAVKMLIDVDAERPQIMEHLISAEGISRWWSSRTTGNADTVGGELRVGFPDRSEPFELKVVEHGDDAVAWHIAAVPEWWAGTTIRLSVMDGEGSASKVSFEHGGFDADSPVIPIITPAWTQILFRLKAVVEGSAEAPFFDF
jgi:hypothetical protein